MTPSKMMKILVINTGSSSIKYQLFDMTAHTVLAHGLVERIGESGSRLKHFDQNETERIIETSIPNHERGLSELVQLLQQADSADSPVQAIGHRVVHGGEAFHEPTLIGEKVIQAIEEYIPLAPLHNPPNLIGIRAAGTHFPGIPQVAVFDTAFHQSIPAHAYRYAIPKEYYESLKIRRYGFHGTSHQYVARQAANYLNKPLSQLNAITIHLGNGCSMTAIENGKSIDTSMGMTPLEGLIMGTRCGDVDPALHGYLLANQDQSHLTSIEDVDKVLNKGSGLKGLTGTNDMRDVFRLRDEGNEDAKLAVEMVAYRIKKYIGAYFAALGGKMDAIIFTAGVGENAAPLRELALSNLEPFGVVVDADRNNHVREQNGPVVEFQAASSSVNLFVIPTNEELEIATQTVQVVNSIAT